MLLNNDISSIRKDYRLQSLEEADLSENPLKQFETWWKQALESKIDEPNAMTLSTSSISGQPSSRIVLLKGIEDDGFVFYTNYESRKGHQIQNNPLVSLVFFWKELERQVRIEGSAKKVSSEQSDQYFSSRPVDSKIGAWTSPQSQVISNREILENTVKDYTTKFQSKDISRPPFWGGYIVQPNMIEFWQGRPGRLHDRLRYTINDKKLWTIERLAP